MLWLHPGCVNPVSHPHQIMHTHLKKEKRKKKKSKENRKHTHVKCYVKCSFHSEQFSTISSLRVEKRADPYWSVLYRHQFQKCDRRRQSVQRERRTTWMPTRRDIISCKNMVHGIICSSDLQKKLLQRIFHKEKLWYTAFLLYCITQIVQFVSLCPCHRKNMALLTEKWPAHTATCSK